MKGLLLCLATQKGYEVLQEALPFRHARPLFLCTMKEVGVVQSFEEPIRQQARDAGIPVFPWKEFTSAPVDFLETHDIGAILCIGWRYLVSEAAIRHLGGEVVIAHDSLLPRLRGFAPLPTALIAGDSCTGVTYLRVGRSVDDGDILWQGSVDIAPGDTIARLIDKVSPLYREGVRRYLRGELVQGVAQDESQATYSIWRDEQDYRIDWSDDAATIERTVRALGPPYQGARCTLAGQEVVLHRAEVLPDQPFALRQPGKVWSLDAVGRPTVICGRGLLRILDATLAKESQSLLPLKSLRLRFAS